MARRNRFSQEVRERAVRMLGEHRADYSSEWEAIRSIAEKIGCSSDEKARMKDLEKENRELRRVNEILRKASAYFAQAELDRRPR